MPTLFQLCEQADRQVSAGISTTDGRLARPAMAAAIHQARAFVTAQDFRKFKRWNAQCVQYHYPLYDNYFQTSVCISRFTLPSDFISGDPRNDGLVFIGSSNDTDNFNPYISQNFRRITSRMELNDFLKHPRMSPTNGNYIGALIDGLDVELYSKDVIKNLAIGAVFSNPELIPSYNPSKDQYPIDSTLIQPMLTYLYQTTFGIQAAGVPDTISSASDQQPQPIQKIR